MEQQIENQTQPPGNYNSTMSQTPIIMALSQNQSLRITPKRRVSFSFEPPQHSIETSKELPYITEEKENNTSKKEKSGTVEGLEMKEAVRGDIGMEDVYINNIKTGYRFSKSNNEKK